MIPHIDLEFSGRAPPLPAVVGVAHAEIAFGRRIADAARRQELHEQKTKEQSAEMSKNRDSALPWIENRNDRYDHPDADQILGLDPEWQRKQEHFLIGIENAEGH